MQAGGGSGWLFVAFLLLSHAHDLLVRDMCSSDEVFALVRCRHPAMDELEDLCSDACIWLCRTQAALVPVEIGVVPLVRENCARLRGCKIPLVHRDFRGPFLDLPRKTFVRLASDVVCVLEAF